MVFRFHDCVIRQRGIDAFLYYILYKRNSYIFQNYNFIFEALFIVHSSLNSGRAYEIFDKCVITLVLFCSLFCIHFYFFVGESVMRCELWMFGRCTIFTVFTNIIVIIEWPLIYFMEIGLHKTNMNPIIYSQTYIAVC